MKALSAIVGLAACLGFLISLVAIIWPRILRMRWRRHAAASAGAMLVVLGFAVDLDPPPNATDAVGPTVLILYATVIGFGWAINRTIRTWRLSRVQDVLLDTGEGIDPTPSRSEAKAARARAVRDDREAQGRIEQERAFNAERAARASVPPTETLEPTARPRTKSTSRLQLARPPRGRVGRVAPRPELGPILSRSGLGKTISFEYCDVHGELTDREMHDWIEYPQYILGWCETKQAQRQFRKDRVQEWYCGDEYLVHLN